jgi:hypothetical protein
MANWQKFIQDYSNYLSSNQSSGPFDIGKKLAGYYVNTIKGTKAIPSGNPINGGIAQSFKPILDLGFGLGFFLLQNSQKSFNQLQRDKNYFDGSPPIPSAEEKKALTEEPKSEGFTLSEFFGLLTEEDFEDIRKNSNVNFFMYEPTGKRSRNIFNYKEPFDFNNPQNTRVAIFGPTLAEAKSNIINYGYMGAIKTILDYNRDRDEEDAQNELRDTSFDNLRFSSLYDFLVRTLEQDDDDFLDKAVRNNTGNASGTEAVKRDYSILSGLYSIELQAWLNVVTPYIQKRFTEFADGDYNERGKRTPASLGISTNGTDFIPIIAEDSKYPTVSSTFLTTIDDYQLTAKFNIARKTVDGITILGEVELGNIQYATAGIPVIDVIFTLTGSEQLNVALTDLSTRSQERVTISKVFGQTSYPAGSQSVSVPGVPSNKVQEQDAKKKAKDSIKSVLATLSPDLRDKLANFGLEAKIADLASKTDPYLVMASSVVLYWSLVGAVPICFAAGPPIPPASIPTPGLFTIIFPGLPITLSKKLRLALNAGLDPKLSPKFDPDGKIASLALLSGSRESAEYKALTQGQKAHDALLKSLKETKAVPLAVSTKLALAFATHLLSLKFLYTGATQAGPATVPTPGFVLSVF